MMRIHLESKRDRPGMVECIDEDGKPNCSFCHGPFYYCTRSHTMTIDRERSTGIVGCNRGKVKRGE
ncbi:MAG: hypothetical protein KAX31_03640 [Thermoplasmata archaeon]|nr:hypothetical protein [Thermoplasmata archaeon]